MIILIALVLLMLIVCFIKENTDYEQKRSIEKLAEESAKRESQQHLKTCHRWNRLNY